MTAPTFTAFTLLATAFAGFPALAQVQLRAFVLSGQQAPGSPAGVTFSGTDGLSINASGKVGLFATVAGAGITASNNKGIWTDVTGTTQLVMRYGDAVPGLAGFTYRSTTVPNLSDSGALIFTAFVVPSGGGGREGLWTVPPGGTPSAFAVGLNQAPGLNAGVNWSAFNLPQVNASGEVAFRAILTGAGVTSANSNTHWVGAPTTLALTGRDADPTVALPGVAFAGIFNEYRFNSAGTFVFRSRLAGAGITASNDSAIWRRTAGGPNIIIVRLGDQAAGQVAGVTHSSIASSPELARDNRVGVVTRLVGPGITSSNELAVWTIDGSGIATLIARQGDQAPGLAAGLQIGSSVEMLFGGQDTIVLKARIQGPGVVFANRTAVFVKRGNGPLTLLARASEPAPGLPAGVVYEDVAESASVAVNASGTIALAARTTPGGRDCIWLTNSSGTLELLVSEQTQLDVDNDPNVTTLRTLSSIPFSLANASDDDGRVSTLSDTGEVVFPAIFTDGSTGVFLASLPSGCDAIDFNGDSLFPDDADLVDFLNVLAGGTCSTGTCSDIDFNNDGLFPDDNDLVAFLRVLAGGPC